MTVRSRVKASVLDVCAQVPAGHSGRACKGASEKRSMLDQCIVLNPAARGRWVRRKADDRTDWSQPPMPPGVVGRRWRNQKWRTEVKSEKRGKKGASLIFVYASHYLNSGLVDKKLNSFSSSWICFAHDTNWQAIYQSLSQSMSFSTWFSSLGLLRRKSERVAGWASGNQPKSTHHSFLLKISTRYYEIRWTKEKAYRIKTWGTSQYKEWKEGIKILIEMKREWLNRNYIRGGGISGCNFSSIYICKEGPSAIGEKLCLAHKTGFEHICNDFVFLISSNFSCTELATGNSKQWNFTQQQNSSPTPVVPICISFYIYIS